MRIVNETGDPIRLDDGESIDLMNVSIIRKNGRKPAVIILERTT